MQSAREKDNLLRHFREAVTMLGPQSKEELLKALIGTDQDGGNLEDSSILLLRTALDDLKGKVSFIPIQYTSSLQNSDPAQLTEQMGALLPRVFFTISQRISPSLDPRECTLLMQCLSILMQKHVCHTYPFPRIPLLTPHSLGWFHSGTSRMYLRKSPAPH